MLRACRATTSAPYDFELAISFSGAAAAVARATSQASETLLYKIIEAAGAALPSHFTHCALERLAREYDFIEAQR